MAHSVQSIDKSSHRPSLRSADTVKRRTQTKFGERCFSHAGPALQLPGIPNLTVLSLPQTQIDFKIFKNSSLSPRVLTFVSAPEHFVSRALYISFICIICICIEISTGTVKRQIELKY